MNILWSWLILTVAVWLTALVLPGVRLRGIGAALGVAAVFGILNWLLGWLLFVVLGLASLGLGFVLAVITRWVVDAIVLSLTDSLLDGIHIRSFGWTLLAAGLMALIGTGAERLLGLAG